MQTRKCWSVGSMWVVLSILVWMALWSRVAVVHGLETPTPTPTATPIPCVGDCDHDGQVTIDELLTMVNIALDGIEISACRAGNRNGDGTIEVNEIIEAVNRALDGCSATPQPTHALSTPSPTGTPAVCGNGRIEPPETCDDGNTVTGDGCSNCRIEPGYTCVREPSFCYFLNCPGPNPTCSGPPSARSKSTPPPPRATQRVAPPPATATPLRDDVVVSGRRGGRFQGLLQRGHLGAELLPVGVA